MSIQKHIVTALLRIYPPDWRSEYGPELTDMLLSRPLSARVAGDVLRNGLRQRVRSAEASTLVGLGMMLLVFGGLVWNIASPSPYSYGWTTLLQDSSITLPRVVVKPFRSELYVLLLVLCGCATYLRHGGEASRPGWAAVKVSFLAGIPIILAGVLMLFGILNLVAVGPGDTMTTFQQHGFTYIYYDAQHQRPSIWSVLLSPLFALPQSWIWGAVGGGLGRWVARRIPRPLGWR